MSNKRDWKDGEWHSLGDLIQEETAEDTNESWRLRFYEDLMQPGRYHGDD